MLKLKCDKGCMEEFVLIVPGTDIVHDNILKTYFCCPHCGQEYVSHYTNTGIRELQDTVRVLQEGPKRNKRKTKRMIQDLQARIKVGMDRLREEIENAS